MERLMKQHGAALEVAPEKVLHPYHPEEGICGSRKLNASGI